MTEREIEQSDRDREIAESVKFIFGKDPVGKILFEDMCDSYMNRSSFSSDPLEMAFHEGQRSVVLHFMKIMEGA